ncbi:cilia- and flagella-associated protein 43 [Anthonomus grandis grandis]|uniref:cilia- and flagella-associated protein 43 n=1 Tax=Anthonomus grandis grandis TaxID=2921223 RepID=UPI0021668E1D|nr:cilia- and flagella-associated protein 43 [Anthonomus grandis grandis]
MQIVMKATGHETLWVKVGCMKELCVMAKTVLMFGRGCFLEFINLNINEKHQLTVNNHKENGEGVQCFRAHSSLFIFAYSESCQQPKLYVKSYPNFELIAMFEDERSGHKSLAFSDSSLLFSLGEKPDYKVTAWNWRSNVKFAEGKNELLYEDQMLRCSYGRPMYLAQMGIGSKKLYIWDVFTVCKTSIFAIHEVLLGNLNPGNFQNAIWGMDTVALYIIDDRGCIYTVDRDFYLELVLDFASLDVPGPVTPSICWFHHGLSVSGPNKEIRHYKKVGATWICDSSYPTEMVINGIISGKSDKCIGYTDMGEIVSFGFAENSITWIRQGYSNYEEISLINPKGDFIIVRRGQYNLDVLELATGQKVSTIALEGAITSISENPLYPFLALGFSTGHVQLVSFYNETKPYVLTEMYLTDVPITSLRFFENSNLLVAGNFNKGEYFIIRGLPGTQIEVLLQIDVGRQTTDYMLVASQNMMRFFVLPVTQNKFFAGNKIIRYCIVDNKVVNVKTYSFEDNQLYFRRFLARKGPDRDRVFILLPFAKRHLAVVETKRGSSIINIIENLKTGHQMKRFLYRSNWRHVITFSCDGFTFVRSADLKTVEGIALNHHRYLHGVKSATCNPSATIVVTLGYDKNLVAVRLSGKEEDENLRQQVQDQHNSPKIALMFKRPTYSYPIEERFIGKSWKEIQKLKNIEAEEEQCRVEKNKILKEFQDIQNILQQLVSDNLEAPDNKKLDLLEFYLDAQSYQKKQQANKEECKELEIYLKHLILAQDTVSEYIINNYYKPMGVQWQTIMGIFSVQKATNYCLLPENPEQEFTLRWIEEQRRIEQFLSSQDTFEPWMPMSKEKILDLVAKKPIAPKEDYTGIANLIGYQEEAELDHEKYLESKVANVGTVSQLYIEKFPGHYKQKQINTFYQTYLQQTMAEREVLTLKKAYNKCFLNTRAIKEREMYNIKEKNARLRHIISEYNYFSERHLDIEIPDPEWHDIENPETCILRVNDNEVPVRPYVSPSEQAILDAKAAEEERLRLLMLADDFRERALMTMMNGVLEIRWEDELKKDVPKPKCMLEKIPEEYNEDDLRSIKEYEEKVAQLNSEREKYKSLLEVEFGKLATNLRDSVRKFNLKLYDCTKYKFHIDSGMNQENLIVNRQRWIQNRRVDIDRKEREIIETIKSYEAKVEENQKIVTQVIEALAECRINLETMQAREKQFEKVYRKEFQDMTPVVQEVAYKLYKKRPKYNYKVISGASILNELAKGVATNEITFAMTQECLEYMKALEALDSFVGLPLTIDETSWALVCKHRRLRIEYEIRLRAAQMQILEGEATIVTFQKRISTKKEKIAMLNGDLEATRQERMRLIHNKEVQTVLRRGLVEIPMTGELYDDFVDAILVPKSEIERVNHLINEAGKVKLKTIQQNMKFRRTMMATEWEHMRLRMTINDLIEKKKDIESVKFSKEMQQYLKNKALGRKPEAESYEMEVELLAAAYEDRLKDKKDKLMKIKHQLKTFRESNKRLDQLIKEVNIDLCHYKLEKDYDIEVKEKDVIQARMAGMLERNMLVQKIQQNHNDILVLQAELELLRLRTFPTFKYKILDE